MKRALPKLLALAAGALMGCVPNLHAQTAPTITTQPASATLPPGYNVSFSVGVAGTGPFTCQWRFNGVPNFINTVVGDGNPFYSGDGGPATSAALDQPTAVAFDAAGNLYVADSGNNCIRETGTNGLILTVAGNGSPGFFGDGGAATNAGLACPGGVATDAAGNLYIADTYNNRIRKVATNNLITTVAGNGTNTFAGDGGAATNASLGNPAGVAVDAAGNVYIADTYNSRIRKVSANGLITTAAGNGNYGYSGDGGAATNASLAEPAGVAADAAGNLYIADRNNCCIRKVSPGGMINTVAGNGSYGYSGDGGAATNASLNDPAGVAVDAAGNLYIADTGNNCIRKVSATGLINTVAGNGGYGFSGDGGAATNATLLWPAGAGLDASGNLFIADSYNSRIREVYQAANQTLWLSSPTVADAGDYSVVVTSPYGSVTSTAAVLTVMAPAGITAQPQSQTVLAGSSPGVSVAVDGSGPFGYWWYFDNTDLLQSGTNNTLTLPVVAENQAGDYTVVITNNYGSVTSLVAALTVLPAAITGQPASQLAAVGGSASFSVTVAGAGPFGYYWYFAATNVVQSGTNSTLTLLNLTTNEAGNYSVMITNSYGSVTSQVAVLTVGFPPTVTVPPAGQTNLAGTAASFSVTAGGTGPFTYQWRFNGTNLPHGIINTVAGGGSSSLGDGGAATNAWLSWPAGVALDVAGNLYIADSDNQRIRKVTANGLISTVAGNGNGSYSGDGGVATSASLAGPAGVTSDASGNLYIADQYNNRIREVTPNGRILTVVGNGTNTFAGDGGAATNASLSYPAGVALDTAGNLYIADQGNQLIRRVDTNGIITTVAGNGYVVINGDTGDGGAATNASLSYPSGVALDAAGNLYIADTEDQLIRRVDTNGIITSVAGGGWYELGDGGAATNACLEYPNGVAVDPLGNLYIADTDDDRIRMVNAAGIITTVAGDDGYGFYGDGGPATNASLAAPGGIAFDAAGNLYIADTDDSRVRKVLLFSAYPTLTLNNLGATNAGNYSVVITSSYGSVTSAVAPLTVLCPPAISVQPASLIATSGSSPSFTVTATGTAPLSYAWYFAATNLLQTGTNTTLKLASVTTNQAGAYIVVITNNYGSVTSQVAMLTMALPPMVAVQPVSQTNVAGTAVSFNVAVSTITAGPFTYQWRLNGTNITNGIITTVAGGGSVTYGGDGGAATSASLYWPAGVAFDAAGNLYIADYDNQRIRKVGANGIIITVAGNGNYGYSGDGRLATNASLYYPSGVALDAAGNLFIADASNNRIRKVATNGIITTVAGNGNYGGSGDGGAATNAELWYPSGVAVDPAGNLYIADQENNRIRKVGTNGLITTVAGSGSYYNGGYSGDGGAATSASLDYPSGVALDAAGNLYIADSDNQRVRMVNPNGIITTVAGNGTGTYAGDGGAATNTSLDYPSGVALDPLGNMYIADTQNQRVRKVNSKGIITTVAGKSGDGYSGDGGAATNAALDSPTGVAFDLVGNLYIADKYNNRIRKVSQYAAYPTLTLNNLAATNAGNYTVVITSSYGSVTSAVATLTVMFPPAISTQPAGQVAAVGGGASFSVAVTGTPPFNYAWYWAGTNLVQSGTNSTLSLANVTTNIAGPYTVVVTNSYGRVTSQMAWLMMALPPTVALQPANQTNQVGTTASFNVTASSTRAGPFTYQWQLNGIDLPNNLITTVAGNGSEYYPGDGVAATNAGLFMPNGVVLDAAGNLYIADAGSQHIRKVSPNGLIYTFAGNGAGEPGLGTYSGDGGAAINAGLNNPNGLALDAAGNLYFADQGNNRIRRVGVNGIISTVAGNGLGNSGGDGGKATNASLYLPAAVALDASGNLFIADFANSRFRKVGTNGIITTVAGGSSYGYSGDGGAATNASLNLPTGVSVDTAGNLYIADNGNYRIRRVDTNGIITTLAGNGTNAPVGDGGAATNAGIFPYATALDAGGNLYIADIGNERIRRVDTHGIITTVAGNGSSGFSGDGGAATNASLSNPFYAAFDLAGNLYISDSDNLRVRVVDLAGFPVFSLPNISLTNAGNYSVVITSPYGSVTSSVASLTVYLPTVITNQPASQFVVAGSNAVFSVAATGSGPFDYEWYWNTTNLVQSGTNSSLLLPEVSTTNDGNYMVVVTNAFLSVTSQVATLSVGVPPWVATQPGCQTNLAGATANFSITPGGTGPFTCQWQFNGTNLPNGLITTVAGNGSTNYAGDGGAATNAGLDAPGSVAFDAAGNLYIADQNNNRIRRVAANGIITTVAGTGAGNYSGDGGPATNAGLHGPAGVALDATGNLYIADWSNNRIRKVSTNGIITTVAGNGGFGHAGDGGPATNADLYYPADVAVDAVGNLYIADCYNARIRQVAANGIITTVAGNGNTGCSGDGGAATNAGLGWPAGVSVDAAGNLYIAACNIDRVRRVGTNGLITTVAGNTAYGYSGDGGAATNTSLDYPQAAVADVAGNLYIADYDNNRVRRVATNGLITTVAGNGAPGCSGDGGAATNASLWQPAGVALDAIGNLYIADLSNNRIREVLQYAGYPTLTLNNLGAANAGNYSVVITSPYGSVTSAVVSLTVTIPNTPPQIIAGGTGFGFSTNQFGFNLNGAYGQTIVVDGSTNLLDWTPLFTNTANGSPFYFSDPVWTNFPWRFYRARLP